MIWFVIIVVILLAVLAYVVKTYNVLVSLRNKVKDNWAQIDVLLKNRAECFLSHLLIYN